MNNTHDHITLAHGNGGQLTHNLIKDVFLKALDNPRLAPLGDAALLAAGSCKLAFTTDAFVVKPLFFPGGDIGKLAVCGTINDLAVMGATPLYLSSALIIEEGFPIADLKRITVSMQATAQAAGVTIVTGDTKVVERGKADGLFITTAGIGVLDKEPQPDLGLHRIRPGDKIVINGTIGDHGIAVLAAREDFPLTTFLRSDCAALNGLLAALFAGIPAADIRMLRDPTRGGIATTLNEFTEAQGFGILLQEAALPIKDEVATISELTGFDPLYIANEGKVLLVVSPAACDRVLEIMRGHELGTCSAVIGEVTAANPGQVLMQSLVGGKRIVDMLLGDMLPRIC